ncbi:MAG: alanine--tRNA ligase, partial [Bacteroidales bacterium]|nr:alanine--tRNA ligase [Bacteroidales bacterium]
EIHVDLRDDDERAKIPGHEMVNKDHPQVIEIWNLVFIQFNRKADGTLESLPQKHVDTGMGFERLCMVLQGKKSNYDTDVFMPLIQAVSELSSVKYGENHQSDIAMRVIADHLRAISFSIADGQLPSNVKAGYVIRRILRRAVRYGYTFLNFREPFITKLVPILVQQMGEQFKELAAQKELIMKVINEEESAFLRTLANGISRLDQMMETAKNNGKKEIAGADAFELFDTYGFPFDLTELILSENGFTVDKEQFEKEMQQQKERSRNAAAKDTGDWIEVHSEENPTIFVGYDEMECDVKILRYRKVSEKNKTFYQLVLDKTPFYAESGGQIGDSGVLESAIGNRISIFNTKKENTLIVHLAESLPENPMAVFHAKINVEKRQATANNHTATHLLHLALRTVLGTHVEQKGSMVSPERLRFDFSHFQKLGDDELKQVETFVNQLIRKNSLLDEHRNMPIKEAEKMGAMALFGEKYGDHVRVVRYGESIEFCGGTHVHATGEIGQFHILTESAIAAGVRRIEALTAENAENYVNEKLALLDAVTEQFKGTKDVLHSVQKLNEENEQLKKEVAAFKKAQLTEVKKSWKEQIKNTNGINTIVLTTDLDAGSVKELAFQLKAEVENLFMMIGSQEESKATITILISDNLVKEKGLHAGNLVREWSKEINGGGGGQPFFATAGGKNPEGLKSVVQHAVDLITTF